MKAEALVWPRCTRCGTAGEGAEEKQGWARRTRLCITGSVGKRLRMRSLLIALTIVSASCAACASELGNVERGLSKSPAEVINKGQLPAPSYVNQARAAFSDAKRRFMEGLPEGYELRVTAGLKDSGEHAVNNLIIVDKIENGWVTGHWFEGIARAAYSNDIYTFSEEDIVDWAIVRPNGITEGNWGPRHLGPSFFVAQWYTGTTCDQAKGTASSTWSEAKMNCGALGARACRVEDKALFLGTCDWDETSNLYRIQGISSYACCV